MRTRLRNRYVFRLAFTWGLFMCGYAAGCGHGVWTALVAGGLIYATCFSMPERLEESLSPSSPPEPFFAGDYVAEISVNGGPWQPAWPKGMNPRLNQAIRMSLGKVQG